MRDLFLQAAGVLGIAAALVHGYLGETKLFASPRIPAGRVRVFLRGILHCSVVDWAVMGALLMLGPTLGSDRARIAIISASAVVYGAGAIGNAWASRGRHFGWALLAVVVGLALAGM
jgi:hypothetical protein